MSPICLKNLSLALPFALTGTHVLAQQTSPAVPDFEMPAPTMSAQAISLDAPFTFVRIVYSSHPDRGRGGWSTDYPDADRAFSAQFQQLTGLETNLEGLTLPLTDPTLQEYPFIYAVEAGQMTLSDGEASALRDYLLGGGFLMLDDFHGEHEWASLAAEFRRVFPGRVPTEVTFDHEVFRSFYEFGIAPQVPGRAGDARPNTTPHYWGLFDDYGRLMVLFCHNSDFGDGWEHIDDPYYPAEFSLGRAVPMGINIVIYALSH